MMHGKNSGPYFLFLLILCLFCPLTGFADQINPFSSLEKVSLKEGTALEATEAKFGKAEISAADKKDSADKVVSIAVLSDLHIKDSNYESLQIAIQAINSLPDVYAVALTGDLVKEIGSKSEYSLLVKALSRFSVPIMAVAGNHDILYKDYYNPNKNAKNPKLRTTPAERKDKFERFKKLLKQKDIRYTRKIGGHLLVFLPNDDLDAKCLVRLSDATLKFLRDTLKANRDLPTIIFCHGPLLGSYKRKGGLPPLQATAQPAEKIRSILRANPQVFLWVSGHIHMSPSSSNFAAKINKVDKVTNIHTPPVKDNSSWVQLIKLSPEKAVVRTYNPRTRKFVKKFDRTFKHKVKKEKPEKEKPPVETPVEPPTVNEEDDQPAPTTDATEEQPTVPADSETTAEIDDQPDEESDIDEDEAAVEEVETEAVNDQGALDGDDSSDEEEVSDDAAATEKDRSAALERIRELVQIIFDSLQKIWNSFMSFLRP